MAKTDVDLIVLGLLIIRLRLMNIMPLDAAVVQTDGRAQLTAGPRHVDGSENGRRTLVATAILVVVYVWCRGSRWTGAGAIGRRGRDVGDGMAGGSGHGVGLWIFLVGRGRSEGIGTGEVVLQLGGRRV